MDIPELAGELARYLTTSQLNACAVVNRAWHASFGPLVWSSLDFCSIPTHILPSADLFERHKDLVHDLVLPLEHTANLKSLLQSCSRLRSLTILNDNAASTPTSIVILAPESMVNLASFLQQNKLLLHKLHLIFSSHDPITTTTSLWHAMTTCHHLTSLTLYGAFLDGIGHPEAMDAFTELACQLEFISLDNFHIRGSSPQWMACDTFPRLKQATLMGRGATFIDLLRKCCSPALRSLTWDTQFPDAYLPLPITQDLTNVISERGPTMTLLQRLVLVEGFQFSDRQIHTMLEALSSSPLGHLGFKNSDFGELSMESLEQQRLEGSIFSRLEVLDISGCLDQQLLNSQRILCGCPKLKTLLTPMLPGSEVAIAQGFRGPPQWVCLSLRRLETFICGFVDEWATHLESRHRVRVPFTNEIGQWAVYQELGQLIELEELIIGSYGLVQEHYYHGKNGGGLDFSQGHGREALVGLKKLRVLDLRLTDQELTEKDVQWIVDTFPKLETLFLAQSMDTKRDEVLQEYANMALTARAVQQQEQMAAVYNHG